MSSNGPEDIAAVYGPEVDSRVTPEMKKRADGYTAEAITQVREQIRTTFNVAIENCTTLEELFELQGLAVSLNGLLRSTRDVNG